MGGLESRAGVLLLVVGAGEDFDVQHVANCEDNRLQTSHNVFDNSVRSASSYYM